MDDTDVQDRPPAPAPPPPPPGPRSLLRRPEPDGKIGGVCAGLADYLGVDVTLVRIAAVVLAFAGPGIPAYLLGWAVIPKAPPGTPPNPVRHGPFLGGGTTPVAGVALLIAAVLIVFDGGLFDGDVLLPGLLIAGGIWLLVRDRDEGHPPDATPPPVAWSPPPPASPTETWPVPEGDVNAPGATVQAWTPAGDDVTAPVRGQAPRPWAPPPPLAPPAPPAVPPAPRPPRSKLGQAVIGALALGAAALWSLTAADVVDPDVSDVLALGVLGIGIGLVVGARYGRARWLIVPGLVLVAALTAVSALDVPLRGGFGERRHEPFLASDIPGAYRLTAGEMVIDLRSLDLGSGRVPVEASIGAGSLQVIVPEDATVLVRSEIALGELRLPGDVPRSERSGAGVDEQVTLRGDEGAGTLVLDLEVGVGEVEVSRG